MLCFRCRKSGHPDGAGVPKRTDVTALAPIAKQTDGIFTHRIVNRQREHALMRSSVQQPVQPRCPARAALAPWLAQGRRLVRCCNCGHIQLVCCAENLRRRSREQANMRRAQRNRHINHFLDAIRSLALILLTCAARTPCRFKAGRHRRKDFSGKQSSEFEQTRW